MFQIFDNLRILDEGRPLRRMAPLYVLFLITFTVVLFLNPAKAGLALYGISKVLLGGMVGYLIDCYGFRPEDRPHLLQGVERGTAWKRRAWIMCAAIVALALVP